MDLLPASRLLVIFEVCGNARERVAPIPNAPRNYLRSIPGTFAASQRLQCKKSKNLQIFQDFRLGGEAAPQQRPGSAPAASWSGFSEMCEIHEKQSKTAIKPRGFCLFRHKTS